MFDILRWAVGIYVVTAFGLSAFVLGYVYLADLIYRRTVVRAFREQLARIPEVGP